MRALHTLSAAFCALLLPVSGVAAIHTIHAHRHGSAHAMVRRTAATHSSHRAEHASFEHPTANISTDRATQIQTALIRQGYLTGDPSGTWDAASIAAMQKLQGDNGWQTKLVPDSRALIKLGLGPGSTPAPVLPAASAPTASVASVTPPASY